MTSNTFRFLKYFGILMLGLSPGFSAPPPSILPAVSSTGLTGGGASFAPLFGGPGGRYVVFLSHANNLVTNDSQTAFLDVFVHDLETGKTTLVSAGSTGAGGGQGDSAQASISQDGRQVVFASTAGNLAGVSSDTNTTQEIFIRDLDTGNTLAIAGGTALAPRLNRNLALFGNPVFVYSGAGPAVVFESLATNLTSVLDTNLAHDIFLGTGADSLVSINSNNTAAGNGGSERPVPSFDGSRIAFLSSATDLVPGVTNTLGDIYVRDIPDSRTIWVSSNVIQHLPGYRCHPPAISTNGQTVAFKASAPGAANASVFHVDLATGITSLLHTNSPTATDVVVSGDGSTVAFDDGEQIFLWQAGVTTLVSKRSDGSAPANGNSTSPVLSFDGQVIAYVSAATDIVNNGVPVTNTTYQIYIWNRQTGLTRLVTQNTDGVATLTSHQFSHIALSPDGTQIAFDSLASDLVPGDLNAASDVFITPVASNAMQLVSRRTESLPSLTAMRNVRIAPNCLTADKRFLLFASLNKNTSPNDAARSENLFVRDLSTGVEEQITKFEFENPKEHVISANGRTVAYISAERSSSIIERVVCLDRNNGDRVFADISPLDGGILRGSFSSLNVSPDGRWVSYLAPAPNRYYPCLYLFDIETRSNRVVSVQLNSPLSPVFDGQVSAPGFSPDGGWLAFGSTSTMLTSNRQAGLFLLNLNDAAGLQSIPAAPNSSFTLPPVFSADSRFVGAGYGIFDLRTGSYSPLPGVSLISPRKHSLSAEGRFVAREANTNGWNVVVSDRQSGVTKVASINMDGSGPGNAISQSPSITPDGRYLVFASRATNLVAGDRNGMSDIYLRDLTRDTTILLSSGDGGITPGNAASTMPILSADGRIVLFQSFADDLAPSDYNYSRDIFIAQISGPDTDGDQMDDDWEMVFFRTLFRNGLRDLDGDGATDLAEFRAGTDPTDQGSIFRVFTITSLNGANTRLVWSAFPGRSYRAQYKDGIGDSAWIDLPKVITPIGTTASTTDESPGPHTQRFYRVMVLP